MTGRQPTPGVHEHYGSKLMEQAEPCPICDVLFRPDDLCATDIELGICHAACLEGSPTVDLNSREQSNGEIDTFLYSETSNAPAYDLREAAEVALGAFKALGAEDGPGAQALRFALVATAEKLPPTAYLRRGEKVPVRGVPWGSMWISDKDDPRAFPVYTSADQPRHQKWTIWQGGEMPVPEGSAVEVILRHGKQALAKAGSGYATRWSHDCRHGDHDDIVFYRLCTPSPESHPPEADDQIRAVRNVREGRQAQLETQLETEAAVPGGKGKWLK